MKFRSHGDANVNPEDRCKPGELPTTVVRLRVVASRSALRKRTREADFRTWLRAASGTLPGNKDVRATETKGASEGCVLRMPPLERENDERVIHTGGWSRRPQVKLPDRLA
jgi:hypothetical protein